MIRQASDECPKVLALVYEGVPTPGVVSRGGRGIPGGTLRSRTPPRLWLSWVGTVPASLLYPPVLQPHCRPVRHGGLRGGVWRPTLEP